MYTYTRNYRSFNGGENQQIYSIALGIIRQNILEL